MYCNGCKYYRSNPVWNYCILSHKECFFEEVDCDLVREEEYEDY